MTEAGRAHREWGIGPLEPRLGPRDLEQLDPRPVLCAQHRAADACGQLELKLRRETEGIGVPSLGAIDVLDGEADMMRRDTHFASNRSVCIDFAVEYINA